MHVQHVTCGAVQLVRCGMAGQWYVTWIVMQLCAREVKMTSALVRCKKDRSPALAPGLLVPSVCRALSTCVTDITYVTDVDDWRFW